MEDSSKQANDRFRNNLLAIISHELNTPLAGILNSLVVLEERFGKDETEYLPMLRRNAERLRKTIQNLMDLSRADAGAFKVRLSELDMENFLFLRREELKEEIAKAGFTFDFNVEQDLPRACADSKRLGWAFDALVLNAVKFSQSPSTIANMAAMIGWTAKENLIRVKLSLESEDVIPQKYRLLKPKQHEKTSLYLVVEVSSSLPAIGDAPESFEQLFEPFSPWRDVDSRQKEGLGVELALTREILQAHEGFIWASEAEAVGEGWKFRLALPVLSRIDELDLVIHNRLYSGIGALAKLSLLLVKASPTAWKTIGDQAEMERNLGRFLFRSSDSVFFLPDSHELVVLMEDCDAASAPKVAGRLLDSLRDKYPDFACTWSTVTGPDEGASAEFLLERARSKF